MTQGKVYEDKMNRQPIIDMLSVEIKAYLNGENKTDGFVMGVYGEYGTGKTFFLNLFKESLNKDKELKELTTTAEILNIKEIELTSSPFTAIIKILLKALQIQASENWWWKKIRKTLAETEIHAGHQNFKVRGKFLKEFLNPDLDDDEILTEFKKELSEKLGDQKVIILIDELDRCNPDFVVEFINIISHFFNIKNIVFVLGVNQTYVRHCVATIYSPDIATSGEGYLKKFIDYSITLPRSVDTFSKHLYDKYFKNPVNDLVKKYCYLPKNKENIQKFIDSYFSFEITLSLHDNNYPASPAPEPINDFYKQFNILKCIQLHASKHQLSPRQIENALQSAAMHFKLLINFLNSNHLLEENMSPEKYPVDPDLYHMRYITDCVYISVVIALIYQYDQDILNNLQDHDYLKRLKIDKIEQILNIEDEIRSSGEQRHVDDRFNLSNLTLLTSYKVNSAETKISNEYIGLISSYYYVFNPNMNYADYEQQIMDLSDFHKVVHVALGTYKTDNYIL